MRGRSTRVFALLAAAAIAGASEPQGVWLDVPYVPQQKNGCGAAVIAMVMRYWQRSVDVESVHRSLYSSEARGVYASDLQQYLRSQGFRTYAFEGQWSDLEDHLRKGRPLIVALKTGRDDLHYVVATGVDPVQGLVLKHDPAVRKLVKQDRAAFERQWRGADNWTLLALPEPPSTAR